MLIQSTSQIFVASNAMQKKKKPWELQLVNMWSGCFRATSKENMQINT